MTPQVAAALVAAFASLVVSVVTAVAGARQASRARQAQNDLTDKQLKAQKILEQDKANWQEGLARLNNEMALIAREEERKRDARTELDKHREPLLLATIDVAHRISNIRNACFLEVYLAGGPDDPRYRTALLGTLYRFAKYWAVVEHLYVRVNTLRFENSAQTKEVAECLRQIGKTYADDGFDERRLMFWREEQRAVADLMYSGDPAELLGYATFVEKYEERFSGWLGSFASDLTRNDLSSSTRLKQLQRHHANLARLLDTDGVLKADWEWLAPD